MTRFHIAPPVLASSLAPRPFSAVWVRRVHALFRISLAVGGVLALLAAR
jgi:hypothetical protein